MKAFLILLLAVAVAAGLPAQEIKLTHVSYDISREVVKALNDAFTADWAVKNAASPVKFEASHAGSSKQAQAIVGGLPADVVTMNQFIDIDFIADQSKGTLVDANWQKLLPNGASPFSSTMVFVVRAGNPQGIKDWADLTKSGLNIVVPNLKTTGNGRYTYLSAFAYGLQANKGDIEKAKTFLKDILKNVPVQANGGRDATTLFDQRKQGDVLVTFEAEAKQIEKNNPAEYLTIIPSLGLVADVYAATIKKPGRSAQTEAALKAYWTFVFSPAGQEIAAQNFFRPIDAKIAAKHKAELADIKLTTVDAVFGGWEKVEKEHFANGGLYDQILKAK